MRKIKQPPNTIITFTEGIPEVSGLYVCDIDVPCAEYISTVLLVRNSELGRWYFVDGSAFRRRVKGYIGPIDGDFQ